MNIFLTFAIICSLSVPTILGRPNSKDREAKMNRIFQECARELNIPEQIANSGYGRHSLEENVCHQACLFRKLVIKDLTGRTNKRTLYHLFSKIIVEAYKAGFESEEFTQQDVGNKIWKCFINKRTECEFFKCVDPLHPPIENLGSYLFEHNLEHTVFNFE